MESRLLHDRRPNDIRSTAKGLQTIQIGISVKSRGSLKNCYCITNTWRLRTSTTIELKQDFHLRYRSWQVTGKTIKDSTQEAMGNKAEDSTWVEQEDSSPKIRKFSYCHIC